MLLFFAYVDLNPRPEEAFGRTEHALSSIVRLVDQTRTGFQSQRVSQAQAKLQRGPNRESERVLGEWSARLGNWREAIQHYRRALSIISP